MGSVVIVSTFRTPVGMLSGNLKSKTAIELGSSVIAEITKNCRNIDGLYLGCALSAGLGQSPARQVAIGAGLNESVNSVNVNKVCGSGMMAVMIARNALLVGESKIAIAGGIESMTNAPYLLKNARLGYRFGNGIIIDHITEDGIYDAYEKCPMGAYAEDTATALSISRDEQDKYAIESINKARKATEKGVFQNEITPIIVTNKKEKIAVNQDEKPFSVDLAKIPNLKPAFKENGTITAASSSSISDGAAAMLMMKESTAQKMGLHPLARIVAQASFSQSPKLFATAPIMAIKQVLEKSKWSLGEVDIFEINEAFAVVAIAAIKTLSIDPEKVNILGGACAIGHPIGASGARIITTLLNAMKITQSKRGLASLCVGGGEGVAMTFELL
ncbi:MAG: acetyl-CoA C-acyltransferase [Holosporaceae bacterium]|nr:acetyl-CoA C-acyltransferase [Holosporaceae bacterium]